MQMKNRLEPRPLTCPSSKTSEPWSGNGDVLERPQREVAGVECKGEGGGGGGGVLTRQLSPPAEGGRGGVEEDNCYLPWRVLSLKGGAKAAF